MTRSQSLVGSLLAGKDARVALRWLRRPWGHWVRMLQRCFWVPQAIQHAQRPSLSHMRSSGLASRVLVIAGGVSLVVLHVATLVTTERRPSLMD